MQSLSGLAELRKTARLLPFMLLVNSIYNFKIPSCTLKLLAESPRSTLKNNANLEVKQILS